MMKGKERKENSKKSVKKNAQKNEAVLNPTNNEFKKKPNQIMEGLMLPPKVVMQIAEEVAKVVTARMSRKNSDEKKIEQRPIINNPIFLDTSAIIDGRVFDLIKMGVFTGTFVILESVLSELKGIADSKDDVKKERGRKGMKLLDQIKKLKNVGMIVLKDRSDEEKVDDKIVHAAKEYKGKIITCDYNLSKKATISGVSSIDIYELATILKTTAIPGEVFNIKVIQKGKGNGQGVAYLPDGTMVVVEEGEKLIGLNATVVVSRIIQTEAGKIFFSKIIEN